MSLDRNRNFDAVIYDVIFIHDDIFTSSDVIVYQMLNSSIITSTRLPNFKLFTFPIMANIKKLVKSLRTSYKAHFDKMTSF